MTGIAPPFACIPGCDMALSLVLFFVMAVVLIVGKKKDPPAEGDGSVPPDQFE